MIKSFAGRTSPRSHSPRSSRHSATQARRLCYLRLGYVPYAPASHRSLDFCGLAELVFRMAKVSVAGYLIPVIAQECREQTQSPFPVKTAFVIPAQSDLFVFTH